MPWDLEDLEEDAEFAEVAPEEHARLEALTSPKTSTDFNEEAEFDGWDDMPEEPVPVVFLDVDGVLHPADTPEEKFFTHPQMEQLRRIIELSQARIVLSSYSPSTESVVEALADAGVGRPIGATPDVSCSEEGRAKEIFSWLESHTELVDKDRWIAIDDFPLNCYLPMEHTVITDSQLGLTSELADEAIQKLGVAWFPQDPVNSCTSACVWCGERGQDLGPDGVCAQCR